MKIGILIPVFNKLSYTQTCLKNLYDSFAHDEKLKEAYEIIVTDDASTDGTSTWVEKNYPDVHLLLGTGNLWWSGGINMGARYAIEELKCNYVLLWNNDIEIDSRYFNKIVEILENQQEEVVTGSKIYADLNNKIVWSMGGKFNPKNGHSSMIGYMVPDNKELSAPVVCDWLTGMGTIVPSSVINKIGYWDEVNYPQYLGDMEFTYRAKINGFKVIANPELIIWNDTENTGWTKKDSLKTVFKMMSDKRSLYYLKANLKFYRSYSKSPFAYSFLFLNYFKFFGGFFKWKLLKFLGFKNKSEFN